MFILHHLVALQLLWAVSSNKLNIKKITKSHPIQIYKIKKYNKKDNRSKNQGGRNGEYKSTETEYTEDFSDQIMRGGHLELPV